MEDTHQFLSYAASVPGLTWNQRVSMVSKKYNTDAATSARSLDPYYKSSEDLRFLSQAVMYPSITNFITAVAKMINDNDLTWKEGVSHVATSMNLPADKAAVILSEFLKKIN